MDDLTRQIANSIIGIPNVMPKREALPSGTMTMVEPQLSAWKPSLRQRIGNSIYDLSTSMGLGAQANRMRNEAESVMDFLPLLGSSLAVDDASSAFGRGDYLGAAIMASGAIPGAGNLAAKVAGKADELADMLRQRGITVFDKPVHSTNRYGEHSSYIETSAGRFRVSDHDANMAYRPSETSFLYDDVTPERLDDYLLRRNEALKAAESRRAVEKAELAAREAPYIERFRAAKEHEKNDILLELYPNMRDRSQKANRNAIFKRWRDGE